ncbi:uncharacterized protein [Hemitrygon akajei]|uniref:uncharacterized protein isoform X2 n=1 Tax=Hemitrygon akajei TaxID=2704970 RepID=UPI003BF9F9D1
MQDARFYVDDRTMSFSETRLNNLLEKLYHHPKEVIKELKYVLSIYRGLSVHLDFYCHKTGFKSNLVNISGTIPVACKGQIYSLPITMWLHNAHPLNPPKCFVKGLPIHYQNHGDLLDNVSVKSSGYLCTWQYPRSHLVGLIEEIKASFVNSLRNSPKSADSQAHFAQVSHASSLQASSSLLSARPLYEAQKGNSEVHCIAKVSPLHSGENASNSSGKRSYGTQLMARGIKLSQLPAKASPDHVAKKKIDPVKQAVDLFHDLHIDNVANTFDLLKSPPKNQGLTLHSTQNTSLYEDKRKVLVLNVPADLPEHRMKDKLVMFFQSCRNGGGEIADFHYPNRNARSAVITFADAKVAERVVQQRHHLFTYNNKISLVELKFYDENRVLAENDSGKNISTVGGVHNAQNWGLPPRPTDSSKKKSDLFQQLLSTEDQNFCVEDVMEVVQSGLNYESALRYLSHECRICSEHVIFSKVVTMTHCNCSFCENCFKKYFSLVIKEQSIVNVVCPICRTPDLQSHHLQENITEYFSFLDIQIRHYLDEKTHELFQKKLRDRTLMEMPNFRWCAHCSFGLLHDLNRFRMDCPSCNKSTCSQCKIPWEQQHEGISCEQFKMWKKQNNPEYQASTLDIYLSRNGIDCPNCSARFDLSRGGCMHFNCPECQYQFCGGCKRPFKTGSACSFTGNCLKNGLHAHHPRNCVYYLRDWSVDRLKQLLNMGNVPLTGFITDNNLGHMEGNCKVIEQRETSHGLKDEQCGQPSVKGYAGFCNVHLKQHLVELVNRNNLDPAILYSKDEILMEFNRWNISVPNQQINEPEEQFIQRLRNKIMMELKLDNQQHTQNAGGTQQARQHL